LDLSSSVLAPPHLSKTYTQDRLSVSMPVTPLDRDADHLVAEPADRGQHQRGQERGDHDPAQDFPGAHEQPMKESPGDDPENDRQEKTEHLGQSLTAVELNRPPAEVDGSQDPEQGNRQHDRQQLNHRSLLEVLAVRAFDVTSGA